MRQVIGRRDAVVLIGGATASVVAAACGSKGKKSASKATAAPTTTCTLAPEVTQGPFWLTDHPQASDLVQDRKGMPFELALTVVDSSCKPVNGAKVDVWHCDASGTYAGVGGLGGGPPGGGSGAATRVNPSTWLQGYQVTGADGAVTFNTIYPGWYSGRAVHIHMKVFAGGNEVHTGQLFFPDDLSKTVFANAPYRGTQDTLNSADSIYQGAGSAALLAPRRSGDGYTAAAQLVVKS